MERERRRHGAGTPAAVVNLEGEFILHLGEKKDARLRFSESRDVFLLDLVMVPTGLRQQGHGAALIARLLAMADTLSKPVLLTARPIGQSSPEALARLVRYYEDFGFREEQRALTSVLMRRPVPGRGDAP